MQRKRKRRTIHTVLSTHGDVLDGEESMPVHGLPIGIGHFISDDIGDISNDPKTNALEMQMHKTPLGEPSVI